MKVKVGFGAHGRKELERDSPSHLLPPHSLCLPGSWSQKLLGLRQLDKVLINKKVQVLTCSCIMY